MKQQDRKKSRVSQWFLGVLTLASLLITMPLLGCSDNDDEIDELQNEIEAIKPCETKGIDHDLSEWTIDEKKGGHIRICSRGDYVERAEHNISYTSKDEETHQLSCSECTYTGEEAHTFGGSAYVDQEKHKSSCEKCEFFEEKGHVFTSYEPAGEEVHQRRCEDCHYTQEEKHIFVDNKCTICGYTREQLQQNENSNEILYVQEGPKMSVYVPPKSPANVPLQSPANVPLQDSSNNLPANNTSPPESSKPHNHELHWKYEGPKHWMECECGFITNEGAHSFKDLWAADATQHWHYCICGAKGDVGNHFFWEGESWERSATQHWYVCATCGSEIPGTRAGHSFEEYWDADERGHFHRCKDCSIEGAILEHVYSGDLDPDCNECGYNRFDQTMPSVSSNQAEN